MGKIGGPKLIYFSSIKLKFLTSVLPDCSCNANCLLSESTNYSSIHQFSAVHLRLGHGGSRAIQMSSWDPGAKELTPFFLFLLIYSLKVTMTYEGFNIDRLLDGMFSLLAQHDLILYSHHCCISALVNHLLYSGACEQDSKGHVLCLRLQLTPNPPRDIHYFGLRRSDFSYGDPPWLLTAEGHGWERNNQLCKSCFFPFSIGSLKTC